MALGQKTPIFISPRASEDVTARTTVGTRYWSFAPSTFPVPLDSKSSSQSSTEPFQLVWRSGSASRLCAYSSMFSPAQHDLKRLLHDAQSFAPFAKWRYGPGRLFAQRFRAVRGLLQSRHGQPLTGVPRPSLTEVSHAVLRPDAIGRCCRALDCGQGLARNQKIRSIMLTTRHWSLMRAKLVPKIWNARKQYSWKQCEDPGRNHKIFVFVATHFGRRTGRIETPSQYVLVPLS